MKTLYMKHSKRNRKRHTFFTVYPILALGDQAYQPAPERECTILLDDGDKYCKVLVGGVYESIKRGYIYSKGHKLLNQD